jgi:uncharacterized protein YggE
MTESGSFLSFCSSSCIPTTVSSVTRPALAECDRYIRRDDASRNVGWQGFMAGCGVDQKFGFWGNQKGLNCWGFRLRNGETMLGFVLRPMHLGFRVLLLICLSSLSWAEVAVISVVGRAEKSVDPNEVNVSFEIWSKNSQAKLAQEAVSKDYQRIKSVVEKFKIKKEDFQTIAYNLHPEYDYNEGRNRLTGYRTSHLISATLRKVEDTGSFLDSLVASGKSESSINIQSVTWGYDKKEEVENTLLGAAVKSAKLQADELAKASGAKIKGVYRLTRGPLGEFQILPGARFNKMAMAEAASSAPTEVAAGPIKILVQVHADYEIQ